MAIYTLNQLRQSAPQQYQSLSDRDLVERYSYDAGIPFEQAADFFNIPKSGVLREMGGQLVAGATVDLPRMLGESIDYFTGSTGQGRVSQGLIRGAERREATSQADTRGMGRVGRDVFVAGSRALAPTVATIGLGAAATLAGGPVGGALVAGGSSAVLFGGTGAYQTRQRVLEETGDVQAADDAAIRSGLLQGLGEGIGTYAGLKLLKPVAKAFRGTPTTAGVARRMTDQSVLRPALGATAANIPVQVATEIAQDVGTSLIEQSYGASAEDLGAISYQSGAAALGMSILLGPLAIGGSARRARNNRRVQQALDGDPSVTPEEQAVALRFITQEAERQGVPVEDRDTWVREQLLPQEQRRTETLERMERIREQLAISDPTDSQSQAELIAEFRGLYDAPSGVTETLPDGTSVTLTNGQLMARELNAYRELIAADSQQQRDPEAEIDLTVEDPSAMVPITAEELIDSLLDTSDLDPVVGLGARSGVDLELPSSAGQSLEIDLASDMLGAGEAVDAQEAPANEFRPTALLPSGEVEATLETTPTIGAEVAPQPSTAAPTQGGIAAQIAAFPAVVRMNERLNEAQSRLDSEVEKLNAIEAVGPQLSRADALRIRNALTQLQPMLERNRKELAAEQKRLEAAQDTVEQADAVRLQNALAQVEQLNQRLNDQRQRISQGLEQVRALNARVDTARVARGFEGAMQLSAEADRAEADRAATPTPDAPTPPRSLRDGIQGMQIGAAPDTVIEFEPGPFAQRSDAELEAIIADDRIPTVQRREAEAELELRQPFSLEGVPTRQRSAQQPARAETGTAQVEATPQVEATLEPSEVIVVNTEAEATPEANAAAKAEDDAVIAALKSAGLLDAEVFDPNAEKTAGPKSLPAQVFAAIRNALLNPGNKGMFSVRKKGLAAIDPEATAKYAPLVERAAAAVKAYGDAYDAINTKISNLVRSADKAPTGYEQIVADLHAKIRVEGLTPELAQEIAEIGNKSVEMILTARDTGTSLSQLYKNYDAALAELTEALGGNPKNMDVIVRLVKDRVQNARKGTMEPKKKKRWEKLDARVSRGWNAERRARDAGVKLSPFDVRPTPIRSANEATAGQNPLRLAYDGLDDMGSEQETRGTEGIIAYLQKNGTGYEKLLSRAIGMVYNRMAEAGYEPQIRFVKSARGKYDPAKNIITVGETASPSVLLHEMLHGALQWYVYNNQSSTEVQSLIQAVKDVVDYKGALGEKAEAVRKVLAKLMKDGNELDAVLELVSYGNTLNSFRSALEAMPKKGTPRTFYQAVEDIWIRVLSVVNELLGLQGKSNTLAADVIQNTFRLLEGAAAVQTPAGLKTQIEAGQQQGRELRSMVEDTDIPSQGRIAASSQFAPAMTNEQFKQFNKKVLPQYISSQFMFTAFGGWWGRTMDTLDAKVVSKLSEHIKNNHPKLTNALSWVNNSFGLQGPVAAFLLRAKDDRRGGSIQVTMFADYLATLPVEQSRVVLRSMDARLDALRKGKPLPQVEGVERKIALLANDMLDRYWEFARNERNERLRAQLAGVYNSKTKQWDGGVKFSQGLVDPKNENALVSPTFGEKAVSKFTKQRTKDEITDDAIMFSVDEKGSPILSGQFIGLYQLAEDYIKARKDGVPMAEISPDAFISVERFNNGERPVWNGLPMDFDNAYLWNVQRRGDKGYRMSARLDFASANAARTSQQIAGAIQNTMGILANSYSAARLTDALNDYARGTPSAVVYDSLDELNSVLNGKWEGTKFVPQTDRAKWSTQIRNRNLLDARSPAAGASAIKDMTRSTSSWVRVPSGPAYGQMADKIVQGSLWNTLQDEYDTRPVIDIAAANNIMRWFKKAKTQYNPGTWGTNVFTNFTMAMMDDIPMATISTASRLYAGYALPTDVARKMGIVLTAQEQDLMSKILGTNALIGNFSSNEIKRDVYDALRANLDSKDNKDKSVASRVMQWMGVEKSRLQTLEKRFAGAADKAEKFDKAMTEWYAAQDNVFRVASMLNKLGQMAKDGKELDAEAFRIAGDHSRFAFLDYDISAKGVRLMRQTAFPFISWPYAAAKLIGHVAVHKPWKLVNLYAGYWMLDALTQALSGDDDDELRKAGPRWARDRLLFGMGPHTHLRVPFMGDDENPVYYNLGRYLAPSSFGDRAPNPFMGADWWPTFISPGGPYISGVLMLTAGVDPFTGDKLVPPTASTWEDMAARLKATQSLFTPNIPFVSIPETEKFFDAISDRTDRSDNFGNLYLSRVAGLRFYDFNVQAATQSQARAKRAIKAQYDMEIARVRRSVLRHETPDYDRFMEQRDKLLERYRKEIEELTGEEQN